MTEANTRRRLVVIGAIVMALFAGLLTRLWFLQVTGGEQLAVAAQQNRDRMVDVPALRGTIYDSKGNWLARTVPVTTLTVDRQKLTDADRVLLEENLPTLPEFAGQVGGRHRQPDRRPADRAVPAGGHRQPTRVQDTVIKVAEHRELFPQVSVSRTSVRQYSDLGVAAANLIGYTGEINDDELKTYASEKYKTGDAIGKTGVERLVRVGAARHARRRQGAGRQPGPRGRPPITEKKPQAGHDVQLTVDGDVQKIALESLQQGIDGARTLVDPDTGNYYEPTGGAVVVLDARTGSVVAMASSPNYDPNAFITHTADAYLKDPNHPLLDRATSAYAPGSTFKMITSIAMLKTGLEPDGDELHLLRPRLLRLRQRPAPLQRGRRARTGHRRPAAGRSRCRATCTSTSVGNDFWVQYRNEGQAAGHTGDLAGDEIPTLAPGRATPSSTPRATSAWASRPASGSDEAPGRIPDLAFKPRLQQEPCADRFSRTWLPG